MSGKRGSRRRNSGGRLGVSCWISCCPAVNITTLSARYHCLPTARSDLQKPTLHIFVSFP